MKPNLQWKIFGEGYDERIQLSTSTGQVLFQGSCDDLVTSAGGEIELCLNYGNSQHVYHHALRRSGNQVILLPTVREAELPNFWISRSVGAQIFPIKDCLDLWNRLRYDISELSNLLAMENSNWILLWFLNIPSGPNTLSVKSWKAWILEKTIAEVPEGYPTVNNIICGEIKTWGGAIYSPDIEEVVTVYLDYPNSGLVEWQAIEACDRELLLLGNGWTIKAEYTDIK